jgi:hypothetical protein
MEAIASRSVYRTAYFRPLKNTEHICILGRVTYPIMARQVDGAGVGCSVDGCEKRVALDGSWLNFLPH